MGVPAGGLQGPKGWWLAEIGAFADADLHDLDGQGWYVSRVSYHVFVSCCLEEFGGNVVALVIMLGNEVRKQMSISCLEAFIRGASCTCRPPLYCDATRSRCIR